MGQVERQEQTALPVQMVAQGLRANQERQERVEAQV